jgi:hypothetical protein
VFVNVRRFGNVLNDAEPVIPLLRKSFHPLHRFSKGFRSDDESMLTAVAAPSNQSHPVEHGKVLHDSLTANWKVPGESRGGSFTSDREPLEKVSSGGVGERGENFGDVTHGESKSAVSWLAMTYLTNSAITPVQPLE